MNRRIEQQYRASWSYNYTLWNMNFRDQLNRSRMVYSLALSRRQDEEETVTPAVIAKAGEEIIKALKGTHVTPDNRRMPVQGDISKAIYASGLSVIARRLLYNVTAVSKDICGTQEIRRRARSMTNSVRVAFGLPIFMTLTCDENHSAIMMRMARLLECDPAYKAMPEDERRWYSRLSPPLQAWETLAEHQTPTFRVRKRVMCNSAVSAVDGFKVQARLMFKHVYGMRLCMNCPDCARTDQGVDFCADAEGCVTEVEGGCLGRMLTLVGTSEFQKKRDEHIHYQSFVECLHTSRTLREVAEALISGVGNIVGQYKNM